MSKLEAEIWNFLIFWCHNHNAAHLNSILHMMPERPEDEVYSAIDLMLSRGLIIVTRFGVLPIVEGSPYSTARKNAKWKIFPRELMMAPGTIH